MSRPDSVIQAFDRLRQDYNAAQSTRFKRVQTGLPALGSGADYHYRSESQYLRIMEMIRDFERNDPIIRAAFNRLTSNVVQRGFTLDVDTGDKELDSRLTEEWERWSTEPDNCDISGENDFAQMQRLAFRSMVRDGDFCLVGLQDGRLKSYEAHRLRTPRTTTRNVVLGVLQDQHRRRLEYWFTRDDIDPWRTVNRVTDMVRVPVRDAAGHRQVFHVVHPDRVSQTRGIGWCVPGVDTISMHGDIQFAKMVQQKVVSCYTVFVKRAMEWDAADGLADAESQPTRSDYINGLQRNLTDLFPGKVVEGLPGEELQGFSPNVPNPEFFQHALLLLTFIAANLDLPLQVLLLDPTKTNFSGWRGAIDQARLRFQQMQDELVKRLHKPVYEFKVRQWLRQFGWLQDALREGRGNVFGHKWHAPAWDYIEPHTDAQADALVIASNLSSRRKVLAKRGLRADQIALEATADNAQIIDAAIEQAVLLNEKHGERLQKFGLPYVDWHEIAAMPLPTGVTMSIASKPAPAESSEPPADDTEPQGDDE